MLRVMSWKKEKKTLTFECALSFVFMGYRNREKQASNWKGQKVEASRFLEIIIEILHVNTEGRPRRIVGRVNQEKNYAVEQ